MPKGKNGRKPQAAGVAFNHAMLYSRDVARAVKFYTGGLGLRLIEEFAHQGRVVYARLGCPGSTGTLALHQLEPGRTIPEGEGVRLYFEVRQLEEFVKKIEESGVAIDRGPKLEAWGWKHAYLRDPDGHQLSLYWAGARRFRKTSMPPAGRS